MAQRYGGFRANASYGPEGPQVLIGAWSAEIRAANTTPGFDLRNSECPRMHLPVLLSGSSAGPKELCGIVYILLSERDWKIRYIPSSALPCCCWLLAICGLRAPAADFAGRSAAVFTALEGAPARFAPALELVVRRFAVPARFDFERPVLVAIASLPRFSG